jgi:aspartate aminotransferase/aminotransferase
MNTKQLPALPLSDKVNGIAEALSIYINQLVYAQKRKGLDIVTLSLGEVFFEIPLFPFDQLNFESGYHYSDSRGLPELRQKIVDLYHQRYQAKIGSIDEVLISSGSKAMACRYLSPLIVQLKIFITTFMNGPKF